MTLRILLLITLLLSFSVPSLAAKGGRWLNEEQASPGVSKGKQKKTKFDDADAGDDTGSYALPPPETENTPPQVSILSPVANSVFPAGEVVTASVSAQDPEGEISFCDFSLNGLHIFRDSIAPFEVDITASAPLAAGEYQLTATCADAGELASSVVVAFSVTEPLPEPEEPLPAPELIYDVALDWTAPATRSDGSVLSSSEIASFEVYFHPEGDFGNGTSKHITAWDAAGNLVTDYLIADLPSGSYLFSIAVVDTDGRVSEFSEPVALSMP
ncbi:MAG: Ig-like domain-containing protein [Pseudomonadales bacterium]